MMIFESKIVAGNAVICILCMDVCSNNYWKWLISMKLCNKDTLLKANSSSWSRGLIKTT